eukprot:g77324.t1
MLRFHHNANSAKIWTLPEHIETVEICDLKKSSRKQRIISAKNWLDPPVLHKPLRAKALCIRLVCLTRVNGLISTRFAGAFHDKAWGATSCNLDLIVLLTSVVAAMPR